MTAGLTILLAALAGPVLVVASLTSDRQGKTRSRFQRPGRLLLCSLLAAIAGFATWGALAPHETRMRVGTVVDVREPDAIVEMESGQRHTVPIDQHVPGDHVYVTYGHDGQWGSYADLADAEAAVARGQAKERRAPHWTTWNVGVPGALLAYGAFSQIPWTPVRRRQHQTA